MIKEQLFELDDEGFDFGDGKYRIDKKPGFEDKRKYNYGNNFVNGKPEIRALSEKNDRITPVESMNIERLKQGQWVRDILNKNVENVLEMIASSIPFDEIARKYGVPLMSLHAWRHKSEYSDLLLQALEYSAESDVNKAERILFDGITTNNMAEANIRRELSQFYRWRAGKRKPKEFGNKIEAELNVNIKQSLSDGKYKELIDAVRNKRLQDPISLNNDDDIEDAEEVDDND